MSSQRERHGGFGRGKTVVVIIAIVTVRKIQMKKEINAKH